MIEKILTQIGDTPLKEPKLAELLSGVNVKISAIVREAIERTDYTLEDFTDPMDAANLVNELSVKVTGFKHADGIFKSTPNTENMEMPSLLQLEEIQDRLDDAFGKGKANAEAELNEYCLSISKVDVGSLTEWERKLVAEQIQMYALEWYNTAMGRAVKK